MSILGLEEIESYLKKEQGCERLQYLVATLKQKSSGTSHDQSLSATLNSSIESDDMNNGVIIQELDANADSYTLNESLLLYSAIK